ncbi:hypothetical protein V1264_024633 [Littorina saxatilis]|uniref:Sodium/calcium exchanger membrane region domain-containing protein n=2 Tax=Littorina saxatilis TaxID=31220 RepID=A0AAN9ALG8_9CAEN
MTTLWIRKRASARHKTRLWLAGGAAVAYLVLLSAGLVRRIWDSNPTVVWESASEPGFLVKNERLVENHRLRRDVIVYGDDSGGLLTADDDDNETCIARSVDNFPGNFMTLKDTQDGGVFVHILFALYLFAALAIVCDDYFVPSLESICEELGLQADVAGATFMAAGSSAPELCTSIVGVFIAKSDVGVGTIVGSAVFNILFIIGVCGIFAGMIVELTWYPLMRDTLFYLVSVIALVIVIQDSEVYWYEALIMLLLYGLYILLMVYNRRLESKVEGLHASLMARLGRAYTVSPEKGEGAPLLVDSGETQGFVGGSGSQGKGEEAETGFNNTTSGEKSIEQEEDLYESPWEIPDRFVPRVYWVAMVPVKAICYLGIPDCRKGGKWRRLYPLTFLASIFWISAFTYIMVWMITIAGDALDIPDTVMGLTLLAAGTSLPDCLASILVARDGYGDMAVSNSIGSNVFDILICLGLPWLIDTAILKEGDYLVISSSGLLYSSLTLLATVLFLLVSVAVNRWRLTKAYGAVCLVTYVVVITLSSLYELNIFADLNSPSCPR